MILPSAFNTHDKVKNFRVHDIMFKLNVSMSMKDNFVTLLRNNTTWALQVLIRRLLIHAEYDPKDMNLLHARSLCSEMECKYLSFSLGMLKVVDLKGCLGLCDNLKIMVKLFIPKSRSLK